MRVTMHAIVRAYDRGATRTYGLPTFDLEALIPVVEGRTPLLIRVSRAADIRQALALAREENVRLILEDAQEAWLVADEIAAAKVPVLIDPQDDLPRSFELLGARLDNAARLQRAGVTIAIKGSRNFNSLRPIRLNAGVAVAYGLSREEALRAITLNPARIWGIADRAGSLEVGKDADVVVWSGDPLEALSYADQRDRRRCRAIDAVAAAATSGTLRASRRRLSARVSLSRHSRGERRSIRKRRQDRSCRWIQIRDPSDTTVPTGGSARSVRNRSIACWAHRDLS